MMAFWRRYLDGIPEYLARHYWWAYLSPWGVWFFDHGPIINLILFGRYHSILNEVMRHYDTLPPGRTLQLTCAYGALTPTLAASPATAELHLMDAAEIQLRAAQRKVPGGAHPVHYARINAEALAYADDSFDSVIIFFLLHELPPGARGRALREALRVLKPGGCLLLAEYGANQGRHPLHRFAPARWLMEKLEPFLHDFWHTDLDALIAEALAHNAPDRNIKALKSRQETPIFRGFYRVLEYRLCERGAPAAPGLLPM
jgi:ubiquinone/menaquinone biosynthesis C-methylase UbiE